MRCLNPLAGFMSLVLWASISFAQALSVDERLQEFKKNFDSDSAAAMMATPAKFNSLGLPISISKFTPEQIKDQSFVDAKATARKQICELSTNNVCKTSPLKTRAIPFAGFDANNLATNVVALQTDHLPSLDAMNIRVGRAAVQPWSGDYWPTYRGQIGARYAASNFPNRDSGFRAHWGAYQKYFPINMQSQGALDALSPSEKYDLLIGAQNFPITQTNWNLAKKYGASGNIPAWFGLCHGWAPAAIAMPRPAKVTKISMGGNSGLWLRFFPDDLKALSTYAWANNRQNVRMLGSRCNTKNPARDRSGRIGAPECFDVNPGAWHLTVLQKMGIERRSFVLDATYDHEVWNQPVVSYKVSYFNLQSWRSQTDLRNAIIPVNQYTNDKFRAYRNPNTVYVVGVNMDLTYNLETVPDHAQTNVPGNDAVRTVQYVYDLELDANQRVIGGEWYQNAHPDMLWFPREGDRAYSDIEISDPTARWSGGAYSPEMMAKARQAAANGQIMYGLIELLMKTSN